MGDKSGYMGVGGYAGGQNMGCLGGSGGGYRNEGYASSAPNPEASGGNLSTAEIADISENSNFSENEIRARNELACVYRLIDLFKWSQGIYNHCTVRLQSSHDEVLINPFGLLYHEVTASSLVTVDLSGKVIRQGSTDLGINQAGYVLHSAIHEGRPDIQCVIHLHIPAVVAVASSEFGLLPISQEALIIGTPAYHEYQGILVDCEERKTIVSDLGDNKVMLLRNHGFVVCGHTVYEAFFLVYHLILACETQVCDFWVKALSSGLNNLIITSQEAQDQVHKVVSNGGGGVNRKSGEVSKTCGIGELEWSAWMRAMDSMGLKTGFSPRKM